MFQFPEKMLCVFKDEKHQAEFEKNGFLILPFYNQDEIDALKKIYFDLHPKNEAGFFPSTFSQDKNYRKTADQQIRNIGQRSIENYCQNIRIVCGSFIAKNPSPESGMCVHQDMSLVDESQYTGINIWVPLTDLSIQNGTLFVLPGSHRIFPTYRGSSIPEFFSNVMDEMIDYLHPILIKAGEAVFFDQSIIHFSPPNFSSSVRIVTNTYFTHQKAVFKTYFWNPNKEKNAVEAFLQDDNFMTDFDQFGNNIHERPKVGKSLGLIPYNFPSIDTYFLQQNFKKTNARNLIKSAIPPRYSSNSKTKKSEEKSKTIWQKLSNWWA